MTNGSKKGCNHCRLPQFLLCLIMDALIRNHQPGDIGWVISKHGEIYTREFSFDPSFEVHIANKFVKLFSPASSSFNSLWIAEVEGDRAGSIGISQKSDHVAFINFVLVLNEFRGSGIAKQLFETVRNHCEEQNFRTMELETYSCLVAARELYRALGFKISLTNSGVQAFGQTVDQEFWQLDL